MFLYNYLKITIVKKVNFTRQNYTLINSYNFLGFIGGIMVENLKKLKKTIFKIYFRGGNMSRTIFTLLLLGAFVISVQAKEPAKKNNIQQAVRFQVIQTTRTIQSNNVTRTRTSNYDLRTRTLVNSSAQVENLGSEYGYSKSSSQIKNLGSEYGYSKSSSQIKNLGSEYGYSKSSSQIKNLGSEYGYSK